MTDTTNNGKAVPTQAGIQPGARENDVADAVETPAKNGPQRETTVADASQDVAGAAAPPTVDPVMPDTKAADAPQEVQAPANDAKPIAASADLAIDQGMRDMIEDARNLLEFAILNANRESLAPVADNIVKPIADLAYPSGASGPTTTSMERWIDFLKAYDGLAALTRPVTARTLHDTRPDNPKNLREWIFGSSPTFAITRMLWFISISFIFLAISYEFYSARYGKPFSGEVEGGELRTQIFGILAPFIYGGLGACAYLLRSAHALIAARAFDISYKPEYLNRILLGVVGGGSVTLFAGTLAVGDPNVAKLSQAAVGFLAGYSTDFLFKTIDRLLEALFPRTNPPNKN